MKDHTLRMDGHVAFIGLGSMGYGMASNLRKKLPPTTTLYVHDISSAQCQKLAEAFGSYGPVKGVQSAREAATYATVVISMVPNPADALALHLDPRNGTIAAPKNKDRLVMDSSTIDPKTSREIGQKLHGASQGTYFDTPVAGGVLGSAAGVLAFMLGRSKNDPAADRIHSIIRLMANPRKIFWCGGPGAGLAAKIADNYLAGTYCVAIAEAMALGIRSGVDKHVLFELISNGSGGGWMFDNHQPVPGVVADAPSSRGYEPFFRHALMIKDLRFALTACEDVGVKGAMAEVATKVFEAAAADPKLAVSSRPTFDDNTRDK